VTDHHERLWKEGVSRGFEKAGERRKKIRGLTEIVKASGWFVPALRYSSLNDVGHHFERVDGTRIGKLKYEP